MSFAECKIIYSNFSPIQLLEFMSIKKNAVIIFALCFVYFSANAQLTKAQGKPHLITDSVVTEMCSCMMSNKEDISTLNQFYASIDSCIKQNATPKMNSLLKEDGFVQKDDRKTRADAIRIVGRKIGQRLVNECGGFKILRDGLIEKENNKKALH